MADTDASKQSENVTLVNVSRQPLLIHLPGGAVRLGPGDRQLVPKSLLGTNELVRAQELGLVVVSPERETKTQTADKTAEPKSQKPKSTKPAEEKKP
jgi:hypothetical protein